MAVTHMDVAYAKLKQELRLAMYKDVRYAAISWMVIWRLYTWMYGMPPNQGGSLAVKEGLIKYLPVFYPSGAQVRPNLFDVKGLTNVAKIHGRITAT
ncbi:hypothetical protein SAMN05660429_02558 [Thalassotalea agarivorans]|uniref:Uncharacterized protein n=1 Tax=Thalassotalea agarivorans TaxID=349064 RepID=A0A1I0GT62_THASX|nr:hypothetical protein SAMN05660429_02558 [Thalassotalea agarivorans]